ncbi:MAG: hypothetical protein U0234_06050 [Sandaracinus sp.]
MRARILAMAALVAACGGATPAPAPAASQAAGTRYRVGDYVIYRYAGRVVGPDPMLLMEEVIEQDGNRLVIEVTLTRGHETVRAWRQTVIDTEENRAANRVEALCQIEGETCTPLANEGNADLMRMYEGLYVTPDAPATNVTTTDEAVDVGGTEMTCHVTRSDIVVAGEPRTLKEIECPDFLWGHAGSDVEMPDKRRVLHVTVQAFGSAE